MSIAVGTIATGTGTTTVSITGLSFQPNAVLLFSCNRGTPGNGAAHWHFAVGFSAGNGDFGGATFAEDGLGTTNTNRRRDIIYSAVLLDDAGATSSGFQGQLTFQSDGFDLTINANANAVDVDFFWIALGDKISDASVGQVAWGSTTGVTSGFVSGLSFQPKCVLFLSDSLNSASASILGGNSLGFGCATGPASSENWVFAAGDGDAKSGSNAESYGISGECVAICSHSLPSIVIGRAILSSFESDGFELNILEAAGASHNMMWIALGGADIEFLAGNFSEPTSSTSFEVNTPRLDPVGVLLATHGKAENPSDAPTNNALLSIGVATGPSDRHCIGVTSQQVGTSETWTGYSNTSVLLKGDLADGIASEMDIVSFGNRKFTIVMDTVDASAAFVGFLAIGSKPKIPKEFDYQPYLAQ